MSFDQEDSLLYTDGDFFSFLLLAAFEETDFVLVSDDIEFSSSFSKWFLKNLMAFENTFKAVNLAPFSCFKIHCFKVLLPYLKNMAMFIFYWMVLVPAWVE